MATIGTEQLLLLSDAAFTGTRSCRGINVSIDRTLIAVLKVNSFTGGSPPSQLTLSLHALFLDGTRFPEKLNNGLGTINMPGLHVMVFGDVAESVDIGDDRTNGKLPRHFEIELETTGGQDSANVMLEIAYL